jgi:hypothetical protein
MSDVTEAKEKEYKITVNGEAKDVDTETLTYEQVVTLAFPNPGDKIFSVSFEKAKDPHEGELLPGHSVEIKEGTEFDVEPTGKS